jgi:hypothetical protein
MIKKGSERNQRFDDDSPAVYVSTKPQSFSAWTVHMNTFGKRIRFWRKPRANSSRFATVLPRVRAMREHCDWQPFTSAGAIQHRRDRVSQAQPAILYRPVLHDRDRDFTLPLRRASKLWAIAGIAMLCVVVLACVLLEPSQNTQHSERFSYQLPGAPPFLAEQLALNRAMESLTKIVDDPLSWQPLESRDKKGSFAPDGTRDVYLSRFDRGANENQGFLVFQNHLKTNGIWKVSVQLFHNRVDCQVSSAGQ